MYFLIVFLCMDVINLCVEDMFIFLLLWVNFWIMLVVSGLRLILEGVLVFWLWLNVRYLFSMCFILVMLLCIVLVFWGCFIILSLSCIWVSGVLRLWFIFVNKSVFCLIWCWRWFFIFRNVFVVCWIFVVLVGLKLMIFWLWLKWFVVVVSFWMDFIWLCKKMIVMVSKIKDVMVIYNRKMWLFVMMIWLRGV